MHMRRFSDFSIHSKKSFLKLGLRGKKGHSNMTRKNCHVYFNKVYKISVSLRLMAFFFGTLLEKWHVWVEHLMSVIVSENTRINFIICKLKESNTNFPV